MIARARKKVCPGLSFLCDDILIHDFGSEKFDCVITAAALHHVPIDLVLPRLLALLEPNGRLILHDIRADEGVADQLRSRFALAQVGFERFLRTGSPHRPRAVRDAWDRHCAGETYLTLAKAQAMANRLLPGARVYSHWLWRYTIVWDKH